MREKQYIINEEVAIEIRNYLKNRDCHIEAMHIDMKLRSHPYQSEQCPKWKDNVCNATWGMIEEEVRKEEREKVLDGLETAIKKNWQCSLAEILYLIDGFRGQGEQE